MNRENAIAILNKLISSLTVARPLSENLSLPEYEIFATQVIDNNLYFFKNPNQIKGISLAAATTELRS